MHLFTYADGFANNRTGEVLGASSYGVRGRSRVIWGAPRKCRMPYRGERISPRIKRSHVPNAFLPELEPIRCWRCSPEGAKR